MANDLGDIEEDAILCMKDNQALGLNGMPAEPFKYGGDELHRALFDIILSIWDQEIVPQQWSNANIYPFH